MRMEKRHQNCDENYVRLSSELTSSSCSADPMLVPPGYKENHTISVRPGLCERPRYLLQGGWHPVTPRCARYTALCHHWWHSAADDNVKCAIAIWSCPFKRVASHVRLYPNKCCPVRENHRQCILEALYSPFRYALMDRTTLSAFV